MKTTTTTDIASVVKYDEYLEDLLKNGLAEVEPVYYTINHGGAQHQTVSSSSSCSTSASSAANNSTNSTANSKIKRGKAYRLIENNEFICFVGYDGHAYKPGDCVYVDSQRLDQPYFIAGVQGFKMTKRDQLNILVKWYYRPCEVPEHVYRTLVQDRHSEHASTTSHWLKDPLIQTRELFISDAVDTYPISSIRGKCAVHHLKDIGTTTTLKLNCDDSFFYVLGYNPENNRLASIQGEIRIGPSHQPRLPELRTTSAADDDDDRQRETLVWTPGRIADSDIVMYLRAARSMAVFAGMCDGGSTEDGCLAAARDQTTLNALDSLHSNNYETGKALQELVKNPVPLSTEKKWTEEETKKFVRGLKQYGKNFFKIRNELLSHKQTGDLIEFYYLWKKTAAANSQRPRPRARRPQTNILRRVKPAPSGKASRPASNEFLDLSSASENECDSDDSDAKDLTGYACHHCYTTTSKNWHHAGKDRALLCADCRLYFKKYGELRPVDRPRTPPPFLFTPVKENSSDNTSAAICHGAGGVKTRRSGKSGGGSRRKTLTPTADMEKSVRSSAGPPAPVAVKSPSGASTSSASSGGPDSEKKSPKSKTPNSKKRKSPSADGKDEEDETTASGKQQAASSANNKKPRNRPNLLETCSGDSSSADAETADNSSSPSAPCSPAAPPTLVSENVSTPGETGVVARPVPVKTEPVEEPSGGGFARVKMERNVYSFREDETLGQSLDQYRRQQQQLQQHTATPPTVSSCPTVPVPPEVLSQPNTNPIPVATSVIKENNFKIKDEPQDEERDDTNASDDENLVDRSLPGVKEPEPKTDDTECHRSANAVFRRHWYRGETNSCSRTDLVFIPKPDSLLAKKREETMRTKAALKEEQKINKDRPASSSRQSAVAADSGRFALPSPSAPPPSNNGPPAALPSGGNLQQSLPAAAPSYPPLAPSVFPPVVTPGGGPPSTPGQDLPFLARLKEYATAAAQVMPGTAAFYQAALTDPVLQSRILGGAYGPLEKERLEQELRERQQELLQRDYELASKAAFPQAPTPSASALPSGSVLLPPSSSATPGLPPNIDPRQWPGLPGVSPFSPVGSSAAAAAALGLIPGAAAAAMMIPGTTGAGYAFPTGVLDAATSERILAMLTSNRVHLERLAAVNPDPYLRLELDRATAQLSAFVGSQHHTHSHTHSHTHLHIHPSTGNPITAQETVSSAATLAPMNHPLWAPGVHPNAAAVNPDLLLQYAMLRPPLGFLDGGAVMGGFPPFPGVPPPGFGQPLQTALDPLSVERLQQLQQQELQRRLIMERDQMIVNQQQQQQVQAAVQHNEMMRRLQQEGGLLGLMGVQHPSLALRPSPSPFDKR